MRAVLLEKWRFVCVGSGNLAGWLRLGIGGRFEQDLQEGGIRRIFGMGAGSFLGGSGAGWGRRGWRSGFDFYPRVQAEGTEGLIQTKVGAGAMND